MHAVYRFLDTGAGGPRYTCGHKWGLVMGRMWLLLAAFSGCDTALDDPFADEVDPAEQSVIYGADDRVEFYQASAPQQQVAGGIVALVDRSFLSQRRDGTWDLDTADTLSDYIPVCNGEPFANQPAPGECSGFLVGPDTIATAGHCMTGNACSRMRFVFDFKSEAAGQVTSHLDAEDVYQCSSIVRSSTGQTDYAIVRLDRTVTGHTPLRVRAAGKVPNNAPVLLFGHPYGLPLKIAGGATVRQNGNASWFGSNLDSYSGNSGSAVVNANTGVVEGILVRGNNDFVARGNCYVSNVCNNGGCPGFEESTRATTFAAYIP